LPPGSRVRTGATARHAAAESCLWLGGLPLAWTQPAGKHKRLQALLYSVTPRDVPRPWIKRVVRKAYRAQPEPEPEPTPDPGAPGSAGPLQAAADRGGDEPEEGLNPYLGYAIVCYRDAAEAAAVLSAMDGMLVVASEVYGRHASAVVAEAGLDTTPPFRLKVRAAEHGDVRAAVTVLDGGVRGGGGGGGGGLDPPL
jgi:hypothetical protein